MVLHVEFVWDIRIDFTVSRYIRIPASKEYTIVNTERSSLPGCTWGGIGRRSLQRMYYAGDVWMHHPQNLQLDHCAARNMQQPNATFRTREETDR